MIGYMSTTPPVPSTPTPVTPTAQTFSTQWWEQFGASVLQIALVVGEDAAIAFVQGALNRAKS